MTNSTDQEFFHTCGRIFNGQVYTEYVKTPKEDIQDGQVPGTSMIKNYPEKCMRCGGQEFYIAPENDYAYVFCSKLECMKIDREASAKPIREKWLREHRKKWGEIVE